MLQSRSCLQYRVNVLTVCTHGINMTTQSTMKRTNQWLIALLVLSVWTDHASAIDATLALDQHVVRSWGVDQGLPQGTVYALAQTADCYVWAATQEGFVRFDGSEFVTFDKANVPQIQNNMTLALLPARDGSLYAATNGGGLDRKST